MTGTTETTVLDAIDDLLAWRGFTSYYVGNWHSAFWLFEEFDGRPDLWVSVEADASDQWVARVQVHRAGSAAGAARRRPRADPAAERDAGRTVRAPRQAPRDHPPGRDLFVMGETTETAAKATVGVLVGALNDLVSPVIDAL